MIPAALKKLAVVAVVLAVSARPLARARALLWTRVSPPDEDVGIIPVLATDELSSVVKGKNALLVGGTRGVGFGTAQALAAAGAHVTIVGRSKESGAKAVAKLREVAGSSTVEFVQGDIGTVCSALDLVERLASRGTTYDYAAVSAAVFPDWTGSLQNEDGFDKSFAVAVIGRFFIYRNLHRFMKKEHARVLNVLASGAKLPLNLFDRDIVSGKRNVTSLIEAMMNFAIGNEIVIDSLFRYDNAYTMVSTHPGAIQTELHKGQGLLFDVIEEIATRLVGISEEEAGKRQASILVSEKLHPSALTYVDLFGYGRKWDPALADVIEQNREWLWSFLTKLERDSSCEAGEDEEPAS